MVVIEAESEEINPSVATSSVLKQVEEGKTDDASSVNVIGGADVASDGFETASEGESSGEEHVKNVEKQQEELQLTDVDKSVAEASTLQDEALKQRALEQANEAKAEGNKLFVEGQYDEALLKYELALERSPDMASSIELRSICHSNRGTCFSKLGKYEDTIKECKKSLELNPNYMKALLRKADAHEKLEQFEEAITGKLKEMGNSLLGRFGMSIDNFKSVQDPSTGAYSIQFQK